MISYRYLPIPSTGDLESLAEKQYVVFLFSLFKKINKNILLRTVIRTYRLLVELLPEFSMGSGNTKQSRVYS